MTLSIVKLCGMTRSFSSMFPVVGLAVAMTILFWWPLYRGAGFIGGDLYPYFFPQKAFYADCLKAGIFPLWNDQSGFGYPILGESQTGAAYPFHFLFYRFLDLNTAYNAEHLLHYVICFVATFLFARRSHLTVSGACLTAVVFTYGWFAPRACLEWAILTGAWMPVALWCVESYLQTGWWRYAIGLSIAVGLQLLAGHFHLAFITQLLIVSYAGWRLWTDQSSVAELAKRSQTGRSSLLAAVGLILALVAGAGLSSIQVIPTWELKQRSSRVVTRSDYDPAYGHLPPWYITQLVAPAWWYSPLSIGEDNLVRFVAELVAPWHWFGPQHDAGNSNLPYDLDKAIQRCHFAAGSTGTNKVEAHCYCGIIPMGLALLFLSERVRRRLFLKRALPESGRSAMTLFWLLAAVLALIYATGILVPIGRHLPGFSFFRGPGRYGIVTTLSIALLSGSMLGGLIDRIASRGLQTLLLATVFASTVGDLWLVSRMVTYAVMVSKPAIAFRDFSEVRQRLLAEPQMPRLLAPGPNVCNLVGVSCVPWYLGMSPSEYVDPQYAMPPMPEPPASKKPTPGTPELIEWLSEYGVTHILNFDPLDEASWQVEPVWHGIDPLLNRVWGRKEPIYLYRFRSVADGSVRATFPGRAYLTTGTGRVDVPEWTKAPVDGRHLQITPNSADKSTVVLTELAFPGWTAWQGSKKLETSQIGMFRAAELSGAGDEVVWKYQPRSVYVGAVLSLSTLLLLAAVAHVRFWHPKWIERIFKIPPSSLPAAETGQSATDGRSKKNAGP